MTICGRSFCYQHLDGSGHVLRPGIRVDLGLVLTVEPTEFQQEPGYLKVSDVSLPIGTELKGWWPDQFDLTAMGLALEGSGYVGLRRLWKADIAQANRTGSEQRLKGGIWKEFSFEIERAENYPDRPSRISAVHLFRTRPAAEAFAQGYRAGQKCWIYRCEIATDTKCFDTYMDWINVEHQVPDPGKQDGDIWTIEEQGEWLSQIIAQQRGTAARYWASDLPGQAVYPETLAAGRVLITELAASN